MPKVKCLSFKKSGSASKVQNFCCLAVAKSELAMKRMKDGYAFVCLMSNRSKYRRPKFRGKYGRQNCPKLIS